MSKAGLHIILPMSTLVPFPKLLTAPSLLAPKLLLSPLMTLRGSFPLLLLLLSGDLATRTCAGHTTTSSSPAPAPAAWGDSSLSTTSFLTTSGKRTMRTTAPESSSSSFDVVSPLRSFISEALKYTLRARSPFTSYSGWRGGSMMYSARWVRISMLRSTARRRTEIREARIWGSRCCGGGRNLEMVE